jgi:hypothetical protein
MGRGGGGDDFLRRADQKGTFPIVWPIYFGEVPGKYSFIAGDTSSEQARTPVWATPAQSRHRTNSTADKEKHCGEVS